MINIDLQPIGDVFAYTDGACSQNPGPGGFCAILFVNRGSPPTPNVDSLALAHVWRGRSAETTNNRQEMQAAIHALAALKQPTTVQLYSDSKYLIQGITEWIDSWKANGWKTSRKEQVKNKDLWLLLDEVRQPHDVHWHHVKGHQVDGDVHAFWNGIADQIAAQERDIAAQEVANRS